MWSTCVLLPLEQLELRSDRIGEDSSRTRTRSSDWTGSHAIGCWSNGDSTDTLVGHLSWSIKRRPGVADVQQLQIGEAPGNDEELGRSPSPAFSPHHSPGREWGEEGVLPIFGLILPIRIHGDGSYVGLELKFEKWLPTGGAVVLPALVLLAICYATFIRIFFYPYVLILPGKKI